VGWGRWRLVGGDDLLGATVVGGGGLARGAAVCGSEKKRNEPTRAGWLAHKRLVPIGQSTGPTGIT
jgi:hypothetical protein